MSSPSTTQKVYVKSIRRKKLDEPVPVYDATVPKYHNFCLGNGVVVHNTAKDARNNNQEILKLSGKPANSLNKKLSDLLSSKALVNIIIALGIDPGSLDVNSENPTFKVDKLRAKDIILLSDPDPDGEHINVLLLSFFFKLLPDLIREGRLYVIEAKLYSSLYKGKLYIGDNYTEVAQQLPDTADARKTITRIKGWGEINPDMMDPIAFDPSTRTIRRITWNDDPERMAYFRHIAAESASEKRKLLGLKENR